MLKLALSACRSLLLGFALAVLGLTLPAAPAAAEITPITDFGNGSPGSNPRQLTTVGNLVYFSADPTGRGGGGQSDQEELYRTDGTAAGTFALHELPGEWGLQPNRLIPVGTTLFFASRNVSEASLWRTDGTAAGTVPVTLGSDPAAKWDLEFAGVYGNELVLAALDRGQYESFSATRTLWAVRPDGAARRLSDPPPGALRSPVVLPSGQLVFSIMGAGVKPDELWSLNLVGANSPHRLGAAAKLSASSVVRSGNRVLFMGWSTDHGLEPWTSDGTDDGTRMLADVTPGPTSSDAASLASVGDDVYVRFGSYRAVRIRGGQTSEIASRSDAGPLLLSAPVTVGSRVCFASFDDVWCLVDSDGLQLTRVHDGNDGRSIELTAVGDKLMFSTTDAWWSTDGTVGGTTVVADVEPATPAMGEGLAASLNGQTLFVASDQRGEELWHLAPSSRRATLLRDLMPTPSGVDFSALGTLSGRGYYVVDDHRKRSLWSTDGTARGTRRIADLRAGSGSTPVATRIADRLVFRLNRWGTRTIQYWETDGTPRGTRPLPIRAKFSNVIWDAPITHIGDRLLLDGAAGLTAYDLSSKRTTRLGRARPTDGQLRYVTTSRYAYFRGYDTAHGHELWRTDGTRSGTRRVADTSRGAAGTAEPLVATGDRVFFTTDEANDAKRVHPEHQLLWTVTDRNQRPSQLAKLGVDPYIEGRSAPLVSAIAGRRGELLYIHFPMGSDPELWMSDGTSSGTRVLATDNVHGELRDRVVVGRSVWFTTTDHTLFSTDGTAAGTTRRSQPTQQIVSLWGRGPVLLAESSDYEPYLVDTRTGQIKLAQDLFPGSNGSYPREALFMKDRITFSANDGASGSQLFAMKRPR